jgi:pilus assembly protein CpaB
MALVSGLLAALFAWYYMGQQRPPKEKAPEEISIPVPIRTLPPQVDLRPEMFRTIKMAKEQVPAGVLTAVASVQGRVSLTELVKDQPVRLNQIAVRSKSLGLAYAVPEGLRGMTLLLDIEGTAGDFVKPGNRVDVVAAYQSEGHIVVRTIVQDVQVLAMGTATSIEPPKETAETTGTEQAPARRQETPVTLAVTPNQAQDILTSDMAGNLRLLLRAMGDRTVTTLPVSNSWTLIGKVPSKEGGGGGGQSNGGGPSVSAATPQPAPPSYYPGTTSGPQNWGAPPTAPPPSTPKRPSVEVIRGGQREVVTPD